jgi:hypothetical protein
VGWEVADSGVDDIEVGFEEVQSCWFNCGSEEVGARDEARIESWSCAKVGLAGCVRDACGVAGGPWICRIFASSTAFW